MANVLSLPTTLLHPAAHTPLAVVRLLARGPTSGPNYPSPQPDSNSRSAWVRCWAAWSAVPHVKDTGPGYSTSTKGWEPDAPLPSRD